MLCFYYIQSLFIIIIIIFKYACSVILQTIFKTLVKCHLTYSKTGIVTSKLRN